ncbi:hypothetical protein Ari01nite_41580 [Paractinoplanes rishiriensis]|uniref:Uncharacterized protein n=1 Tax=Paractinoplanes rishiriensis TaxID=1050105 RepID=A0A919K119_9ACTN|nr:hypothetical protein Ari01nite_41580 [Actinoplanes rishiriensis]
MVTKPSIADRGHRCHVRSQQFASISLRSVWVRCSNPDMILRRAALASLWLGCTAALFLALDLYT